MIALLAFVLAVAPLNLAAYRQRLVALEAQLAAGHIEEAKSTAADLLHERIETPAGELAPDAWVLGPIARGEPHRARLGALLRALPDDSRAPISPPDARAEATARSLLEELRRDEQPPDPERGGELTPLPGAEEPSVFAALRSWTVKVLTAVWQVLVRFFEWLSRLWAPPTTGVPKATGDVLIAMSVGLGVVVAAAVTLAFRASRRSNAPLPEPRGGNAPEDEDPLSRNARGWERHALELAQQGRWRAAIRAWYHALLVQCYAAGLLHHRRGRTNWEYVAMLPASVPWREHFTDLTRRFDAEWYGRAESSEQALREFQTEAQEILRQVARTA